MFPLSKIEKQDQIKIITQMTIMANGSPVTNPIADFM